MALIDTVNRIFREFKRYTGDGLPSEPTGAALPIGDPQSGPYSPKKSELRSAFTDILTGLEDIGTDAEAALAELQQRYLGAFATDPTTDNDGGALIAGALYWNTGSQMLRVYDLGTASWNPASFRYRNTWSGATSYITGDLASFTDGGGDTSVWYANAGSTNEEPGSGASWTLFISGGSGGASLTDFDTVADLLADTVLSYSVVTAGDIINAQGYRYEVAASAAVDHYIATAGGVKLYVQPGMGGKQYAEAWGVVADGVTDYRAVIQSIIDKTTGPLTVVLPAGTTKAGSTLYLRRSRVGIEGAGPGGQSFYMYENAAGGRAFCGDTDQSVSMNTYVGNFLRDFEVLSTGVETNDASIVVDFTSFSYGTFDIRAQTKRADGIIYYGQGNNGASPYYNKLTSTGLFGWTDQTQIMFMFEHGLWSGGSPGPNSNFIGPITEATLIKNFLVLRAGQANHFSNLGIESVKDAYFVLGGRAASDSGGFSSGSNTHLTLNDTSKSWVVNIHSGSTVRTIGGTAPGQIRKITSNTGTQLLLQDPWAIIPGSDTTYEIYKPLAVSNHFSHIRGEDTNAENPEFVRALYDSDGFSFDSWYVDSIGAGSIFADYTGSVNNKVLGSKTFITYTFKNPGTSVVVDAWERNSSNGGLPIPGKYVVDFVSVRKSLGNSGGSIFCQLDCGGGSLGAGSPTFMIDSPAGYGSGMDLPAPTEKAPIIGTNNPLFLTLTTGSDVVSTEDFTVTIGLSLFD